MEFYIICDFEKRFNVEDETKLSWVEIHASYHLSSIQFQSIDPKHFFVQINIVCYKLFSLSS